VLVPATDAMMNTLEPAIREQARLDYLDTVAEQTGCPWSLAPFERMSGLHTGRSMSCCDEQSGLKIYTPPAKPNCRQAS